MLAFDRFACTLGLQRPLLTPDLVGDFRASMAHLASVTRYRRICALRQFSVLHHLEHPESHRIEEIGVRKCPRVRFIVLSEREVTELTDAPWPVKHRTLHPSTISCLLGLLYCCGLRIGEALALELDDFDRAAGTLLVRCGKFGKRRRVPLHPSARKALLDHLARRAPASRVDGHAPLFANTEGKPLTYASVHRIVRRLLQTTGIARRRGPVRPHDLRHSFASTVLRRAAEEHADLHATLPRLATVMGHVSFGSTQIYLHADPVLLARAGNAFRQSFLDAIGD